MTIKHLIILCISTIYLGCDVIRVVRITNKSTNSIELQLDFPQKSVLHEDSGVIYNEKNTIDHDIKTIKETYPDLQIDKISDGLVITLQPKQFFDIAGKIGFSLKKIQLSDLNYSKLTVYSKADTIVAENKKDILKLLYDKKTKYIKRRDKNDIGFSNKYFKHIIVRQ